MSKQRTIRIGQGLMTSFCLLGHCSDFDLFAMHKNIVGGNWLWRVLISSLLHFLEQQMKFVFAVGSSRFVSPVGFGGDSSPEVLII